MNTAASYPVQYTHARMRRLYARFLEWCWYYHEGLKNKDSFLVSMAVCNIVLYGGRSLLANNELLFPFHKWFMKVLEGSESRPAELMDLIDSVLNERSEEAVECFIAVIKGFRDWGVFDRDWAQCLMSGEDFGGYDPGL